MINLTQAYGGALVNLLLTDPKHHAAWLERANSLPALQLSSRSLCDLELLATGAFSPLDRFMGEADYWRVLAEMRLADGTLFPMPITLPVAQDAPGRPGEWVTLRGPKNDVLAVMQVVERYCWDHATEARQVFGTTDTGHPLVAEMTTWGPWYLSGPLIVLALPTHYSFTLLRRTPAEVRYALAAMGRAGDGARKRRCLPDPQPDPPRP